MSGYLAETDALYRRLLEQVYNSGAIPGYFGRSTADLYRRINTGQQSQAVGERGVEYGPPTSAAEPPVTARTGDTPFGPAIPARAAGPSRPPVTAASAPQTDSSGTGQPASPDTARSPDADTPDRAPGRDLNDRIANFGYAMAASRNPSLFGMIGEAGLALQRGDREDRQDTRQEREVDVMAEYRRAQIDLGRAEAEWQRDPNNPLNVARLAEARYRLAAAANAGRSGGGSASEGQGIPIERDDGTFGVFYPRTGRVATAPEGIRPMGATANTPEQRRLTDWNNRRAEFERTLFQNPLFASEQARNGALQEWTRRNPPPTLRGTGTGTGTGGTMPPAPTEGEQRVRIQFRQ